MAEDEEEEEVDGESTVGSGFRSLQALSRCIRWWISLLGLLELESNTYVHVYQSP